MRSTAIAALVLAGAALVFSATGGAFAESQQKPKADSSSSKRGPRGPRGPRGYQGLQGPQGVQGAIGPQGPAGPSVASLTTVNSATITLQPNQSSVDVAGAGNWHAVCPAGQVVVGTGFDAPFGGVWYVESFGTLVGGFAVNYGSIAGQYTLQAICAPGSSGGASAASANSSQLRRYKARSLAAQKLAVADRAARRTANAARVR